MKKKERLGETVAEFLERIKHKRTKTGQKEKKPLNWLQRRMREHRKKKVVNRLKRKHEKRIRRQAR